MEKCIACGSDVEHGTCCPGCGVYYGEPCVTCGERGYHTRDCKVLDEPGNENAAYL